MTIEEKNKRKHIKEMKSFKNKMNVNNLAWFESLDNTKQYDILFIWKKIKNQSIIKKPVVRYIRKYNFDTKEYEYIKKIFYPSKLKYFLKSIKKSKRFQGNKNKIRTSLINKILNEKDNKS